MKLHLSSFYVNGVISCVFIVCLYKLGLIQESDFQGLILKVFAGYLAVCRHLQSVYWLEPAGSHGVWSLDDYQMLVFYFGAAQLHGVIVPI